MRDWSKEEGCELVFSAFYVLAVGLVGSREMSRNCFASAACFYVRLFRLESPN